MGDSFLLRLVVLRRRFAAHMHLSIKSAALLHESIDWHIMPSRFERKTVALQRTKQHALRTSGAVFINAILPRKRAFYQKKYH